MLPTSLSRQVHFWVRFTLAVLDKILLGFGFHSYESKELHENLVHYVTQILLFSSVLTGRKTQLPFCKEIGIIFSGAPLYHTFLTARLNHYNHFITVLAFQLLPFTVPDSPSPLPFSAHMRCGKKIW